MIIGGGLCGLSVVLLLSMVAAVVFDGEPTPAAGTPRHARAEPHRKRRGRFRRRAPWMGLVILLLALAGALGSVAWTAGYFLDSAGSRDDVSAFMRRLEATSGRYLGGRP